MPRGPIVLWRSSKFPLTQADRVAKMGPVAYNSDPLQEVLPDVLWRTVLLFSTYWLPKRRGQLRYFRYNAYVRIC